MISRLCASRTRYHTNPTREGGGANGAVEGGERDAVAVTKGCRCCVGANPHVSGGDAMRQRRREGMCRECGSQLLQFRIPQRSLSNSSSQHAPMARHVRTNRLHDRGALGPAAPMDHRIAALAVSACRERRRAPLDDPAAEPVEGLAAAALRQRCDGARGDRV